jgi:hypothetical protein
MGILLKSSRDGSVGITKGCNTGSRIPAGPGFFLFYITTGQGLPLIQTLSQLIVGGISAGIRRPGREAVHLYPYSAEIN